MIYHKRLAVNLGLRDESMIKILAAIAADELMDGDRFCLDTIAAKTSIRIETIAEVFYGLLITNVVVPLYIPVCSECGEPIGHSETSIITYLQNRCGFCAGCGLRVTEPDVTIEYYSRDANMAEAKRSMDACISRRFYELNDIYIDGGGK